MTISTSLEAEIDSALVLCLQRHRVEPNPAWKNEAAAGIIKAARKATGDAAQTAQTAEHGLSAMDHAGARELAAEMLAAFAKGTNGWSARVSASQVEEWREKLGEPRA